MDYEEAYLEALERAKAGKPMDEVFPELKESEDERIRKYIQNELACLRATEDKGSERYNELSSAIAYLEKQKDNKFASRVLPCSAAWFEGGEEFEQKEQKPVECEWPNLSNCIKNCKKCHGKCFYRKEPYEEQKPAEWSEDFEDNIRNLLHDKLTGHSEDGSMSWTTLIDDKILKDIVNGIWFYVGKEALKYPNKELSQPEWSEEDKKFIKELCDLLASIAKNNYVGRYYAPDLVNKLQSLRPQPHWKPSEEQIKALKHCVNGWQDTANGVLESLYNDLQKLI